MIESALSYVEILLQSDIYLISAFAVWLVTFVIGENGALISLTFAHQGYISLFLAVVFTFLGSLSADLFWYFVTRGAIRPLIDKRLKRKKTKKKKTGKAFFHLADKYPYHILILIKFMVGIRLILTIYIVAKHKIPLHKYLLCNIVANTLFVGVLFALVWTLGESLSALMSAENGLFGLVTTVFIVAVIGNIALRLLQGIILRLLKKKGLVKYK